MTNKELHKLFKELNISQRQIAKTIGISESTLSRWFRQELSNEQYDDVMNSIREIWFHQINHK